MPTYHVRPQDLGATMWKLSQAHKAIMLKAVQVTVQSMGPRFIQEEISRAKPMPVDRGTYRSSWRAETTVDGAVLYNPLPYAAIIEHGRRPGSPMPPLDAIAGWVRRKLRLQGAGGAQPRGKKERFVKRRKLKKAEAMGLAYVIARSIAKRGLPAKHILAKAVFNLNREIRKAIDHALGRPVSI